jgi:hypothetical protein
VLLDENPNIHVKVRMFLWQRTLGGGKFFKSDHSLFLSDRPGMVVFVLVFGLIGLDAWVAVHAYPMNGAMNNE